MLVHFWRRGLLLLALALPAWSEEGLPPEPVTYTRSREPLAYGDPPVHRPDGTLDRTRGRPLQKDRLDGLLPGSYWRDTVVRPGQPSPAPEPVSPADLTPFPHAAPPGAPPEGPAEAVDRRTERIDLARFPKGHVELAVHHLLGTVTYEGTSEDAITITMVRRGTGSDVVTAAQHRETIDLALVQRDRETIVSTCAWGFPDFDRAIDYVRRGERPAEAHLFIKAPARTHANLCTWGGTVTLRDAVGRATVQTTSGMVDVKGFKGKLTVITGTGTVWLGGDISANTLVRTVDGRILATGYAGALDARSRVGGIRADFRALGPGDQHLWTETGSVDVTVPRTAELVVDVHAHRELLTNGLPLANVQEGSRRFRGVLNEPRNWLEVRSKHGPITISGR